LDGEILQAGAYYGRTYSDVYVNEMNYRKSMVGKLRNGSLSNTHIINFAKYAERRHAQEFPDRSRASGSASAYMMTENDTVVDEDTQIFAVLDTGCNNTCHGDMDEALC
jgi:hypothetical protein